jgi:hypothetical protein
VLKNPEIDSLGYNFQIIIPEEKRRTIMSVIEERKGPDVGNLDLGLYLKAFGYVVAIVVGGAVGWALVGYISEGVYYAVGLLIGIGMTRVIAEPFKPLNLIKGLAVFGSGTIFSLLTIAKGEFLISAAYCMFELEYPFAKTMRVCYDNLGDILTTEAAIIGYVTVVIGAAIGIFNAVREPRG